VTLRRLLFALLLSAVPAAAQTVGSWQQWCVAGGQTVSTSGITSTTEVQASYPNCQVEVFLTGTTTPATIYSTATLTTLANPFCANNDGSFVFYAATSSQYDVTISNSSAPGCNAPPAQQLPAPFTFQRIAVNGSSGGGGTTTPGLPFGSIQYNSAGVFAGSICTQASTTVTCAGTINVTGTFGVGAVLPTVCGLALDCVGFGNGTTAGTPTSGQNYFRATASGWVCSVNGGSESPCINITGFPTAAQIGDALRYNVNGDSAWDAVNATYKNTTVTVDTGSLLATGILTQTPTGLGSSSLNNPNTTDGYSLTYSASASASTSTVIGVDQGTGGNASVYGWGAFYRWTLRWSAGSTSGERCWLGLGNYSITGTTQEAYAMLGTVKYATNNPQVSTLAFRYTEGTDTSWQAISQIGGGSQTIVSTGVAVDTNPHYFDITSSGGTANFFIDHALVATISTNVPTTTSGTGLGQGLFTQFWACDNENVATAISAKFYWMGTSTK
jgi:hypothetical protein